MYRRLTLSRATRSWEVRLTNWICRLALWSWLITQSYPPSPTKSCSAALGTCNKWRGNWGSASTNWANINGIEEGSSSLQREVGVLGTWYDDAYENLGVLEEDQTAPRSWSCWYLVAMLAECKFSTDWPRAPSRVKQDLNATQKELMQTKKSNRG